MARKRIIHIELTRSYTYPEGKAAEVHITAVCGHKPARDNYTTTTYPLAADCPRCLAHYRRKLAPIGNCAECQSPIWYGDANPCRACYPDRPADNPYRNAYIREAILMSGASTTGWDHPGGNSHTSTYDGRLAPYLGNLIRGGWVVDKRACTSDALYEGAINGPMCDVRLPAGEVSECPPPSGILAAGVSGGFRSLALRKLSDPSWKGLDKVSIPEYLGYWRELGAKIGIRVDDAIIWEDGEVTPIPAESVRWTPHPLDTSRDRSTVAETYEVRG